ncbi:MAG TPA: hypothetical protein VNY55_05065 [Mycobacterium sp.]|jgi:DHA2 family multidrug resistance protein|nr:hypothetical protein [Mycobacterium sp.]
MVAARNAAYLARGAGSGAPTYSGRSEHRNPPLMAALAAAPTSSEVAHGSTQFTVNPNTAASVGAALMSVLLSSRLNRSGVEHVASDLSHAYAAGVLVAMIMIAATTIPASFLPKRPTARMA